MVRFRTGDEMRSPTERTLQRHFAERGLNLPATAKTGVFGRFEARKPNDLWTGDAPHGPKICDRKTYLFAFIEDHSRAVVGHRWGFAEDTVRLAAALRPALAVRGVPSSIYVDNGSAFVDAWLLRACTSRSGTSSWSSSTTRPARRSSPSGLNRLFTDWCETVYHRTVHSDTTQSPIERWPAGIPRPLPLPSPEQLREAFLWSELRTVTTTGTVSLHGNAYQTDPGLSGLKVELVFDPFALTDIEVRHRGRSMGKAVTHTIGRHSHPKASPEPAAQPATPTGIKYLALVDTAYTRGLSASINYAALLGDDQSSGRRDSGQ